MKTKLETHYFFGKNLIVRINGFYHLLPFLLLFIVSAFFQTACKKSDSSHKTPEIISQEKSLDSIPPPTWQELTNAMNEAVRVSPNIINSEVAFGDSVLILLKTNKPNVGIMKTSSVSGTLYDAKEKLTDAEWNIIKADWLKTFFILTTVPKTQESAAQEYPCDDDKHIDDAKRNAIQHSYWTALMTSRVGSTYARRLSFAHEPQRALVGLNTLMDLHNDLIGIKIAEKYPDATEKQLLTILTTQRFQYVTSRDEISDKIDALVYIVNKNMYDETLYGTLTNPDSGGPWNATFDLNQCGRVIRGQLVIVRGKENQLRRFSGTVDDNGLSLIVSDPYSFENPTGLVFCTNMTISLTTGSNGALSGTWLSSNCNKGGTVDLKK